MPIKVKPLADVVKKYTDVTPTRSAYYASGVANAGSTWEANTAAAGQAYKAAVQAGNIDKMFSGGVKKAGAAKYQRKATGVGADRYGPGVQAGALDYAAGMTSVMDTISKVDLPARQPRGSAANYSRSQAVGNALNKARLAARAAGG